MTTMNLKKLPLDALSIAPENPRQGEGDETKTRAIADSIEALGGLLQPLLVYETGPLGLVWEGGRRLRALQLLNGENRLPTALAADGIDVIVTSRDDAARRALATFVREDMHPADQFLAFNRLFDEGQAVDQIAAACAVDSLTVSRLLRFRSLAPEILAAFKVGRFGLDVAFAFTVTEDHEAQRQVLASFGGKKPLEAREVRQHLNQGSMSATDKYARIVGREAYVAAGGTFLTDLFSRSEADERWANRDLVGQLVDDLIDAQVEKAKKEGWGKVVVSTESYGWQNGYDRMQPAGEAKKESGKRTFTAEQMAEGTAFVVVDWDAIKIERGFKPYRATKADRSQSPGAKDPARFGWAHRGHFQMTQAATLAVRGGLMEKPEAAHDAVLMHLAWEWLHGHEGGVSTLTQPYDDKRGRWEVEVRYGDPVGKARIFWADKLPTDRTAFNEAVAALAPDQKTELLAASFASTIEAHEPKTDMHCKDRWASLGWMARATGVDMNFAWTPDEGFFKGGSREAIVGAIEEINPASARQLKDAKKASLVRWMWDYARENGWVPQLLRDLVTAPEPRADKAPKAKSKASRKVLTEAVGKTSADPDTALETADT